MIRKPVAVLAAVSRVKMLRNCYLRLKPRLLCPNPLWKKPHRLLKRLPMTKTSTLLPIPFLKQRFLKNVSKFLLKPNLRLKRRILNVARAVVVLNENRRVIHAQLVPEITNESDYDAALAALK